MVVIFFISNQYSDIKSTHSKIQSEYENVDTKLNDVSERLDSVMETLEKEEAEKLAKEQAEKEVKEKEQKEKVAKEKEVKEDLDEKDKKISQLEKKIKVSSQSPSRSSTSRSQPTKDTGSTNLGTFSSTAYCSCTKCCGPNAKGITASGTKVKAGRTIAVDPKIIPLGSKVLVNGKQYIAEDTGSAIKGKIVDIYFDNHNTALDWGRKNVDVQVIR